MSDTTELYPAAEKAITSLKKPIPYYSWDNEYTRVHKRREQDEAYRLDILLNAITKISEGRATSSDYLIGLAAEALEALDQVDLFIAERDAAAEAAELQAAE